MIHIQNLMFRLASLQVIFLLIPLRLFHFLKLNLHGFETKFGVHFYLSENQIKIYLQIH